MTIIAAGRRLARTSACALGLCLAGCASSPTNTTLNSVHQPVVERTTHAIDLAQAGGDLPAGEQRRLADWFTGLDLGYGDRIAIAGADPRTQEAVAALAARHGVLMVDAAVQPPADLQPNQARILVSQSRAFVPGCPDWSARSSVNVANSTSPGFGCAVNGNLAAMIADPEHLLRGARGTGETLVMSAAKAIESYRQVEPTGAGGLPEVSSRGGEE